MERYKDRNIKGRDRDRVTDKKRDRADNKNPEQSRVAQLVHYKEEGFKTLPQNYEGRGVLKNDTD